MIEAPKLEFSTVNLGCRTLNDRGRTVAIISPQGLIDWLLPSPAHKGELITRVRKEPHLSYVLGLKIDLHMLDPLIYPCDMQFEELDDGCARIISRGTSPDGKFESLHIGTICVNPETGRFEWRIEATLSCRAAAPVPLRWIEYTNLYPHGAGRCMLFAPEKTFERTLLTDKHGTVWDFPHQHVMHYGGKICELDFEVGSVGGFFGGKLNPVVEVTESTLPPDWGICDMYYDLHCGARPSQPILPASESFWAGTIRYLDERESADYVERKEPLNITAADYERHRYVRLDLGKNIFRKAVRIDDVDDASGFLPKPPVRVWDRETGRNGTGALRICNAAPTETVWSAVPPTQIPCCRTFQLKALAKTDSVAGKGFFLRVRYHNYEWRPEPHFEWAPPLESVPVAGTTDWVRIETPILTVPAHHFDHLVWIDLVLDGQGTAWLTDMDVELQGTEVEEPVSPMAPVFFS